MYELDLYTYCKVCELLVLAILWNWWSLTPLRRGPNYCSYSILLFENSSIDIDNGIVPNVMKQSLLSVLGACVCTLG